MITKIIIQINSVLSTKLSLPIFFQLPTIKQLANYIDNNHSENKNSFVLMREGRGSPLFMLPGESGNPLTFVNFLTNYTVKRPIYSISYPQNAELSAFNDIQAYAKHLINQIKLIQPYGPYNFLGYSFGGSLSFEMVLQLQHKNEKVDLLSIVSADAPLEKGLFFDQKTKREFTFLLKPDFYLLRNI